MAQMDPIAIALTNVYAHVPEAILNTVFVDKYVERTGHTRRNVGTGITNDVINARVLTDANISSGKIKDIVLRSEFLEPPVMDVNNSYPAAQYTLYRIPPDERDFSFISEVIAIKHPHYHSYDMPVSAPWPYPEPGSDMNYVAHEALSAQTGSYYEPTPPAVAIDGELIHIMSPMHYHKEWVAKVRIAFNRDFPNLNQQALNSFRRLVLYAVQAHIYVTLIIDLEKTTYIGGMPLGTMREIVMSYQDANEKYEEEKRIFSGAATLDPARSMSMLKLMI